MKNKTIKPVKAGTRGQAGANAEACVSARLLERFHAAMRILTGKWKGEILWLLVQGKHRFGELRRSIPGITQHMLTTQLRDLERHGLVKRTVYPEVPPRVEYELTPSAHALRPVFEEIMRWSEEHAEGLNLTEDEAEQRDKPAHSARRNESLRA